MIYIKLLFKYIISFSVLILFNKITKSYYILYSCSIIRPDFLTSSKIVPGLINIISLISRRYFPIVAHFLFWNFSVYISFLILYFKGLPACNYPLCSWQLAGYA